MVMTLLLVSRQISIEAADLLYSNNHFIFRIKRPLSMRPEGLLSMLSLKHLPSEMVCKLTHVRLEIAEELQIRAVYKRVEAQLKQFVDMLGPDHVLRKFVLHICPGHYAGDEPPMEFVSQQTHEPTKHCYCLEPLASMRRVRRPQNRRRA